ncbi:unnamed protein product [Chrysoparadoxa australica]
MLVLYETPAGYALFKVADESKVQGEDMHKHFATPEMAAGIIKLKAFSAFEDTASAVAASSDLMEGKMGKSLKKFLTKNIVKKELKDRLAVADSKLGGAIKEKLAIPCFNDTSANELIRGIRSQLEVLLAGGLGEQGLKAMRLGLSHSLSRYKLKFSADKVDTMVVQAIGLLDELDKEINTYAMRVREWYGWHFPELAKVLNDNMHYAKCVVRMGERTNAKETDFSDILGDENTEALVKENAEISMGTEVTEQDMTSIKHLAEQVVSLSEYRIQLFEYLKSRMNAIAPNLTVMVGELVGARLIAHAGSLLNLAKHPASTVQILGAEKALFRALKTKHDTPKYGLIYHASLIGQTSSKNKGKISRVLAAKTALSIRVDALSESTDCNIGYESRAKVENRIRQLEGGFKLKEAGAKVRTEVKKYDSVATAAAASDKYNDADDMVDVKEAESGEEVEAEAEVGEETPSKKKKKDKKEKKKKRERESEGGAAAEAGEGTEESAKKKKKKKRKSEA